MVARLSARGGRGNRRSRASGEFAATGKRKLTIVQALSHQARPVGGLAGPIPPADWFDWDGICARLAATKLQPSGGARAAITR